MNPCSSLSKKTIVLSDSKDMNKKKNKLCYIYIKRMKLLKSIEIYTYIRWSVGLLQPEMFIHESIYIHLLTTRKMRQQEGGHLR